MADIDYIREIEMTVIGDLLMWYAELREKINTISPDDFELNYTKAVFKAIQAHAETCADTLEIVSLPQIADEVILLPIVKQALIYSSTSLQFNVHITALKELSFNRRIKAALIHIATDKCQIRLDDLQELIDREKSGAFVRSWIDKSQVSLDKYIESIGKPVQRIMTGFTTFDRVVGGLRVPSVMIIGAYPSTGKTALALNIAAYQTQPVIIFSLEMSASMIYERLISAYCKIDYDVFSTYTFTQSQEKLIRDMGVKLKSLHKYVFDDVYDIETQSAIAANIKPALVIVDYMQKVRTVKKTDNRRNEIDYISGMYKQIANYNRCAIILLSQITRMDKVQPTMSSLKESGSLEADGDYVALLHRPYVLKKDDPTISPDEAYMLVDKNKFGKTGKINLRFDVKHQKFYEAEAYMTNKQPPKKISKTYKDNPFI